MKPFAFVITYRGTPTRAMGEQAAAQAELDRLNRQYRGERDVRQLVPVFAQRHPLGQREIAAAVASAHTAGAVDAFQLIRAVERAHGIE